MLPQPMSRSEFRSDDSHPDPTRALEQYQLAGFLPDLALDLVLNELADRAATSTNSDATFLNASAEECARIRRTSAELSQRGPAPEGPPEIVLSQIVLPKLVAPEFDTSARRPPYQAWTLVLGALAILA